MKLNSNPRVLDYINKNLRFYFCLNYEILIKVKKTVQYESICVSERKTHESFVFM